MDPFTQGALLYGVLLISLVCHEAAHALFALLGGDRTAYYGGQVTLNPIPHIRREPFGTVILPIGTLLFTGGNACFGYAHAPYDPLWAHHHPRRAALMSAAGPLANIVLVLIAFLILKLMIFSGVAQPRYGFFPLELIKPADGSEDGFLMAGIRMASTFVLLNTLLAMINLIPLPPFDGAGVVEGLFPKQTRGFYDMVRSQTFIPLLVMIALLYTMGDWFWPVFLGIRSLL